MLNVITIVIKQTIFIKYKQREMRRELKPFATKIELNTKDSNVGNER
jgi:hypothetical protein